MADTKVSSLTALTSADSADELLIIDKSDTTSGAGGTGKKITASNLKSGLVPTSTTVAGKALTDNITLAVDDLSDVTITTPSNGQVLKYNGSAWVNDSDSTGTGGGGDIKADGTVDFTAIVGYDAHKTFTADTDIVDKKYVDDAITVAGGYTDENAQDAVGGILTDSSTIDFTYDDAAGTITAALKDVSATYAVAAKGVTNGDTHDHSGGDGAQINHTTLSNIGTNTHAAIDTHIADTTKHFTQAEITTVGTVTTGNTTATVSAASDTAAGKVELATATETTTGTDATRAVTPDSLAGSVYGQQPIGVLLNADTALTTGDSKAGFRIPAKINGWLLTSVAAHRNSGTGVVTIQLAVGANDLLSTPLTIDDGETDSSTAATPAVINTAYDDATTGQWVDVDVDGAGTNTLMCYLEAVYQTP